MPPGSDVKFFLLHLFKVTILYISPGSLIAVSILKSQWLNAINVSFFSISQTSQGWLVLQAVTQGPRVFQLQHLCIQHAASKPAAGRESFVHTGSPEMLTARSPRPVARTQSTPNHYEVTARSFICVPGKSGKDIGELRPHTGHTFDDSRR